MKPARQDVGGAVAVGSPAACGPPELLDVGVGVGVLDGTGVLVGDGVDDGWALGVAGADVDGAALGVADAGPGFLDAAWWCVVMRAVAPLRLWVGRVVGVGDEVTPTRAAAGGAAAARPTAPGPDTAQPVTTPAAVAAPRAPSTMRRGSRANGGSMQ